MLDWSAALLRGAHLAVAGLGEAGGLLCEDEAQGVKDGERAR